MSQPPESEAAQGKRQGSSLGWLIVCLLPIYVLSFGPVCRIAQRLGLDGAWLGVLYAPVLFVAQQSDAAKGALVWYLVRIWGVDIG